MKDELTSMQQKNKKLQMSYEELDEELEKEIKKNIDLNKAKEKAEEELTNKFEEETSTLKRKIKKT